MAAKKTTSNGVSHTIHFTVERETKRTIRYAECNADGSLVEDEAAKVGVLYVKKTALPKEPPTRLTITVTA